MVKNAKEIVRRIGFCSMFQTKNMEDAENPEKSRRKFNTNNK